MIFKGMILLLVDRFFLIYGAMLFVRVVGSWLPEIQNYRFMHFISFYTDPYLALFRRVIPPLGFIDFSPIVAFFCLGILRQLVQTLILLVMR